MLKKMKNNSMALFLMFIISLFLRGGIFTNTYLSLWTPTDLIVVISILLCFFIDQYIVRSIARMSVSRAQIMIFFITALLLVASQVQMIQAYIPGLYLLSIYHFSIGIAMLMVFGYQMYFVAQISGLSIATWSILKFSTYFSLVISIIYVIKSFNNADWEIMNVIPSQANLLLLFFPVLAMQALAIGIYIYDDWQERYEIKSQIVQELGVWNILGFIKNTESIRRICARLDQDVTLALFQIDSYHELKDSMNPAQFETFMKTFTDWVKFSLRKHDQLALIDDNIYAVLLPFTNLEKGETACMRLSRQTKKEIISKNFLLSDEFSMSFGLTLVNRKEKTVIPAMKRAAVALSRADVASVAKYNLDHIPTEKDG